MSSRSRSKQSKGKRSSRAPVSRKKDWKSQHKHLFSSNKRSFGVGRSVLPANRDLSRFVKWPRYVRLQRQRAILKKRLKVPPAVNQFARALDKNQATNVFRLLSHYRPESAIEKKQRLAQEAGNEVKGASTNKGGKPKVVKFGINHITELVESRKAKLVVIAHDVDPIDIVVWLPALCRRMDVPYCIVKGKSRLGHLVHQKTVTAVALTEVRKEHMSQLEQLINNVRPSFNDQAPVERRRWGGGIMGFKAQAAERIRERQRQADLAQMRGR